MEAETVPGGLIMPGEGKIEEILKRLDSLKREVIPDGVETAVTRDYGQTAQGKVNDLLASLVFAILTVVGLLALTLGWREALVVALAVPLIFSPALFVNYALGFTVNRVKNRAQLVAMIEDMFPECALEVVARTEDDPSPHELSCRERRGVLKGNGLGLASAFGIIQNHGGFIDVYSEQGKERLSASIGRLQSRNRRPANPIWTERWRLKKVKVRFALWMTRG